MAYTRAHCDWKGAETGTRPLDFAQALDLKNVGLNVYVFARGEGFDFFHNHREQEEVYFCLEGELDLLIGGPGGERLTLACGDVVRVEPRTLRAIGNLGSDRAVVLIAGACPHTYPAGLAHHDVIADVLTVVGEGETEFRTPAFLRDSAPAPREDEEC